MREIPSENDESLAADDYDVLVVGYGPTGQTLAALLGRRGWRVGVVERWTAPYGLPRAVHFDDESARILALAGIGERIAEVSVPAASYEWFGAAGERLLHIDWSGLAASGWPRANMFGQPELERVLDERVRAWPSVEVMRGREAVGVGQASDRAELAVRDGDGPPRRLRASYLIGCDGAGSLVRAAFRPSMTDLGFHYDWLIVDVVPTGPGDGDGDTGGDGTSDVAPAGEVNLQYCDPRRPTTAVSGGPGRRRWEFMRLPGETLEELNRPETAWRLLAERGVTPDAARLERHTVYTFEARWADAWRSGRLLIAGDAAHLMPPFAGQGMCAGLRDAANLAWKLDLVLGGAAGSELLDTYTTERVPHVRYTVEMSTFLGGIMCVTDPAEAAARDKELVRARDAGEDLSEPPPPALGPGVVRRGPRDEPAPPAGELCPQWRVERSGRVGRLDDVVGTGFLVLAEGDAAGVLTADQLDFLGTLGARLVRVVAGAAAEAVNVSRAEDAVVIDIDDGYLPYLRRHGWAVLVRPDFYVFGAAARPDDLPPLVEELRGHLRGGPGSPRGVAGGRRSSP